MDNMLYKKKIQSCGSTEEKNPEVPSATLPNSVMESIARGTMAPTRSMLGTRENLAPSLQAKMQGAFGADFSGVEVYRSQTARDAGFNGIASGNKVALAPDIDLNSHAGQAVLGHELSHVVAQAQGIGGGRGFLGNSGLERQADIQGERAASGMRAAAGSGLSMETGLDFSSPTIAAGGMESAALTPISATAGAFGMGAPMQGDKNKGHGEADARSAQDDFRFLTPADLPEELRDFQTPELKQLAGEEEFVSAGKGIGVSEFKSKPEWRKYNHIHRRGEHARENYVDQLLKLSHPGSSRTRNSNTDLRWREYRDAWGAECAEHISAIRPEEALSLNDYTTKCGNYNGYKRGQLTSQATIDSMKPKTEALDRATSSYKTKSALTVYRVINNDGLKAMMHGSGDLSGGDNVDPRMLNGAMLYDPAYMSTSIFPDLDWPGDYRLAIDIPAGANVGAPLMDTHFAYGGDMQTGGDRGEFLLKSGLTLQVTGVSGENSEANPRSKTLIHCKIANVSEQGEERR